MFSVGGRWNPRYLQKMNSDQPKFRVLRQLGSGAHGTVFEVEATADHQRYALKRLKVGERLHVQAKRIWGELSQLGNPGLLLPTGWRTGEDQSDEIFFPLIRTCDAHDFVQALGPAVAFSLLVQGTSALSALHRTGLCHRDIKPENLLVEETASEKAWLRCRLLLADLELAGPPGSQESESRISGSIGYLAPETLNTFTHTFASDMFALGMWAYWAISGDEPLKAATALESIGRTCEFSELPPVGRIDSRFAGGMWDELLHFLTHPDPARRPQSAMEFLAHLLISAPQIDGGFEYLADILWSPGVPLMEEREAIGDAIRSFDGAGTRPTRVVLSLTRPAAAQVAKKQVQLAMLGRGKEVIFTEPDVGVLRVIEEIEKSSPQLLVLDQSSSESQFSKESLRALLNVVHPERTRACSILIIRQAGRTQEGVDALLESGEIAVESQFGTRQISRESFRRWVGDLFGGSRVDENLVAELERMTEAAPLHCVDYLANALRLRSIQVARGTVHLDRYQPGLKTWASSVRGVSERSEDETLTDEIVELSAGIPGGIPRDIVEGLEELVGGFSRAVRLLHETGRMRTESDSRRLVACKVPIDCSETVTSTDRFRRLAQQALVVARRSSQEGGDKLLILGLKLRGKTGGPRVLRRAVAAARLLLNSVGPIPALAMLYGIESTRMELLPVETRARASLIRAKALWVLGEFEAMEAAWQRACELSLQSTNVQLAARCALEMKIARGSRGAGYTEESKRVLSSRPSGVSKRIRDRIVAEDCVLMGGQVGYENALSKSTPEIMDAFPYDDSLALMLYACARRAEERVQVSDAATLYREASKVAIRSGAPFVAARVVAYAAGFELKNGRLLAARQLMSTLDSIPPHRLTVTDKYTILSLLGGVAYESGDLTEALRINAQLASLAALRGSATLECNARRNIGAILLAMSRLGECVEVTNSLSIGHLSSIRGSVLSLGAFRALVLAEIGDLEAARSLLDSAVSLESEGTSPFRMGFIWRAKAKCEILAGSTEVGLKFLSRAIECFKAVDAGDEVAMTCLTEIELVRAQERRLTVPDSVYAIERSALELEQRRVWTRARWLVLREASADSLIGRLDGLEELIRVLRLAGEGLLEIEALYTKAELQGQSGRLAAAADTIRDAMKLLRQTADGLAGYPGLREVYLADPRRQRFLKLARTLKEN